VSLQIHGQNHRAYNAIIDIRRGITYNLPLVCELNQNFFAIWQRDSKTMRVTSLAGKPTANSNCTACGKIMRVVGTHQKVVLYR
jgi:hypothetical protein